MIDMSCQAKQSTRIRLPLISLIFLEPAPLHLRNRFGKDPCSIQHGASQDPRIVEQLPPRIRSRIDASNRLERQRGVQPVQDGIRYRY